MISALLTLVPFVIAIVIYELVRRAMWPSRRALGDALSDLERGLRKRAELRAYRQAAARHSDRAERPRR